ncbi:MAG TPA: serine hydrolase domain-containing protein [Acidimicrobiales bacterium]|nr:serine hydrolase domain-containing protein [Acidimicrobiales bacterium]
MTGPDTSSAHITGHVEPGFEPVRDAFAQNFQEGRELGSAFCVHVQGRKVVDLCGGSFDDAGTKPYGPDALQLVFSTTKGATAVCANLLAQRGLLDLDAPVATYWPEFAQAGKESVPVRYLLCHQAGVPAIDRRLTPEELQSWTPAIDALAEQTPFWAPGTGHGYHALSYGYLVGEVVRRISGRSLGTFFAEEVAGPLGLEFFIGLPEEFEPRVSPIVGANFDGGGAGAGAGGGAGGGDAAGSGVAAGGGDAAPSGYASTLLARSLNLGGAIRDRDWMNQRAWHAAEVPGGNGITNAASLSRMYAALIGTVEGGPSQALLSAAQVEDARTPLTSGADQVFASVGFMLEQKIGLGFWRSSPVTLFGGEGSFGHGGAGGSYGFADPENGLAVGYVMNKMAMEFTGDSRSHGVIGAVYDAIGASAKYF